MQYLHGFLLIVTIMHKFYDSIWLLSRNKRNESNKDKITKKKNTMEIELYLVMVYETK